MLGASAINLAVIERRRNLSISVVLIGRTAEKLLGVMKEAGAAEMFCCGAQKI